jgi:hypothetical protein
MQCHCTMCTLFFYIFIVESETLVLWEEFFKSLSIGVSVQFFKLIFCWFPTCYQL